MSVLRGVSDVSGVLGGATATRGGVEVGALPSVVFGFFGVAKRGTSDI